MYVPLGNRVTYPAQVTLEFRRSGLEWLGDAISIVAVIGLVIYAFNGFSRWRRRALL
jgi:hypothetical protein